VLFGDRGCVMMGLAWFPVPRVVCFCCGGELNVSLGAKLWDVSGVCVG
jgi:hypothetical protein